MSMKTNIESIAKAIPDEFMKAVGASNLTVASERTIRFDIPTTPTGINRIKVTAQPNGEFRLRTYRVEEVEDVPSIEPGSLQSAIKTLAGIEQPKPETKE